MDGAGPGLLQLLDHVFHRIDSLDEVGAGALGDLDGHRGAPVHARDRGGVLERRLDLRDVAQGDRGTGGGHYGNVENVLRLLEQRRHLDGKTAGLAFKRAGGNQRVEGLGNGAELIDGQPIAADQGRIEDDLDCFVTRPAQLGGEHSWSLLDRILRSARNAQQRALGHVAGESHHQHGIERQVHLEHLRLVHVARQVVLGLVDLGAHIRERGLGIEAGLELEEDEATAFESGGTHLLHVAHRLELGLDRAQQQAFGIFRADAALGELDVDHRDLDVGLRLLGDGDIGDEAGAEKKDERGDGEPRVVDGVVDEP